MAGSEPRLGTTATYMRHNDHGTTRPSTEIDRLHDRTDNEYRIFSAGSVRKWSKFGLGRGAALRTGSSSPMSLGRSGLPDRPNDRSSEPSATYKDAPRGSSLSGISSHALPPGQRVGASNMRQRSGEPGFPKLAAVA